MRGADVAGSSGEGDSESAKAKMEQEEALEREAYLRVINTFRSYHDDSVWEIERWETNYKQLSDRHKAFFPELPAVHLSARRAVAGNAEFIAALLSTYESDSVPSHLRIPPLEGELPQTSPADMEKVRYVFKNLCRDWSKDGEAERAACYGPLIEELGRTVAPGDNPDDLPSVLVPGAGLGRLCTEIARRGYACQGNEYSYFMLLTSSFMLNCVDRKEAVGIFPWVLNTCNNREHKDQLRQVLIPDEPTVEMNLPPGSLSMCAGDFVEVYSTPDNAEAFDAVVTCFFIDTAHNVAAYLEVIWHALRPGGVWINHGPLLWHWADAHTYLSTPELSIEVPLESVLRCAAALGFLVERRESRKCTYTANTRSMMQTVYETELWTMRKPHQAIPPSKVPRQGGATEEEGAGAAGRRGAGGAGSSAGAGASSPARSPQGRGARSTADGR